MYRALSVLLLAASCLGYHVTRKEFVPLIINGDDADEGEWPHQVFMEMNYLFLKNLKQSLAPSLGTD